jgi:xanthine dehydrogenase iron-sulfur cluster and FAD-binding subunit A
MENFMWHEYINAVNIDEVIKTLDFKGEKARIIAGATDLMLEMERGVRKGIETLVDITRIPGLEQIHLDEDSWFHLGPLVTHNHVVASSLLHQYAQPLVQAAWQVGSPQIRNRGTIAGNIITASPANDTITPLMALRAEVVLKSIRGMRVIPLNQFYLGVRRTVMRPDEVLVEIRFPALKEPQKGAFLKLALRQAQAISVVNVACILSVENGFIRDARITLGSVAPTIVNAKRAESFLAGKSLVQTTITEAADITATEARPIDDVRGSANYRIEMVRVACQRILEQIAGTRDTLSVPNDPVLLWGYPVNSKSVERSFIDSSHPIETTINGKSYTFRSGQGKSLLRLLREEGQLIGTKEGCAEGECGACTVYLDGKAVMSCLVPAPRAHKAQVTTIEGLAQNDILHPLQKEFINAGAVQCGYCTPGLIMSGAKLLEEKPHPSQVEIRHAITGNLCRCTGYYNIIRAVEMAANQGGS